MPMTSKLAFTTALNANMPVLLVKIRETHKIVEDKTGDKFAKELTDVLIGWLKDTLDPVFQGIDATHTTHTHPIVAQPVAGTALFLPVVAVANGTTMPPAG